jgi:3-deoxy-D-manno-octulosonic-acid transferase
MYALYSVGLSLAFGWRLPGVLVQAASRGRYRSGLAERVGRYRLPPLAAPPVWLHAVSVGEVVAAAPLARALRQARPGCPLLVSTVTETGRAMAVRRIPEAAATLFFPLDFAFAVRRALLAVHPRAVLLAETEIWPNFLRACRARGVPVAVVNGRISPRSFRRYRWVRGPFRRVLSDIACFAMQTAADAERIAALGAPRDRVHVTGNLKFDALAAAGPAADAGTLRRDLGLAMGRRVLLAGSTHAGEEAAVLDAMEALRAHHSGPALVLAPRHPERCDEVERLVRARGLGVARRSAGPAAPGSDVVLVDTIGELGRLYAAADVAFVGGSLVPVGGHNILEPAAAGVPIVVGPHLGNFVEIAAAFAEAGAMVTVPHAGGLGEAVRELLEDPDRGRELAARARGVVETHRGATRRTLDLLAPILREDGAAREKAS